MRCVQEANLLTRLRVDQRRQERRVRVRKVKGEVLNVVADAAEGGDAARLGKGVGGEGDVDAGEEALGEQVAAGGGGLADGAEVRG